MAIFDEPTRANIKASDIESLIIALGGKVREGKGSHLLFILDGETCAFYRPHPGKETKRYLVRQVRTLLEITGYKND